MSLDWKLFQEILWFIKDEGNDSKRRTLILKYVRLCELKVFLFQGQTSLNLGCAFTDDDLNDTVDNLLEFLHKDNFENNWTYNVGFLLELLQKSGVNVEKLLSLSEDLKICNIFRSVELEWKLNNEEKTKSSASNNEIISMIRRVFRIVLSLGFFQVEKYVEQTICSMLNSFFSFSLKCSLSNDDLLFLFLLGFYLQLDKRFQDMNTIHLARRLMVNSLTLLNNAYWNEKV